MKTTDKFGLKKPESTDFYNIEDHNYNMDIIEKKLEEHDTHAADKNNPHEVTKETIGLERVPNVTTNDQTPTYATASTAAELSSGEKLSVAFGKIAKAIKDLISHIANKSNPHGVTKSQLGLENVDNKSSATIRGELTSSNVTKALGYTPEKGGTAETDNAMAHSKDVPSTTASYTKIDEIGGMTRKCTNLIPYPYNETTKTQNGITFTDNGDGTIAANGISTDTVFFIIAAKVNLPSGEYYISDGVNMGSVANCRCGVGTYNTSFSTDGTARDVEIRISSGTTLNNVIFKPMINKGSTALPYEPYFDGLRSAPITEVESVGENLIPFPYYNTSNTTYGVEFTVQNDGGIKVKGAATEAVAFYLTSENTTWQELGIPKGITLCLSGASAVTFGIVYADGTILNDNGNGRIITTDDRRFKIRILVAKGSAVDTIVYPMLNKGATALPYTPYFRNTLPIPEAVQSLDGYGLGINESVYNYIDFEKKQFVNNVAKVVFDGTETWYKVSGIANAYSVKGLGYKSRANGGMLLMNDYEYVNGGISQDNTCTVSDAIYVLDTDYDTLDAWKTALAERYASGDPLTCVYVLETPIITDISDILTDNIIGVEGSGTLTFANEYGYDVPNEVVFYLNSNDVVCANEFVGDLNGTAMKAKYAENVAVATKAVQDADGNKISETYETKAASDAKFNEVKKSVADGKSLLASTISAYGISTASDASFETINNNITAVYGAGVASASSEGYTSGYNKGVEDADARVNTESASYITGYANGQEDGSELDGTAVASKVLNGATFYNTSSKTKVTGTMADYSSNVQTVTPSASQNKTAEFDIPDGYHTKIKVNSYNVYNAGYNAGYNDGGIAAKETYYDYLEVTASCQVTLSSSVGTAKYVITDYINQGYEFVGFKKVYNTSGEAFVSGQMLYMDSATGAQEARCTIRATSTSSGTKSFDAIIVLKKHPM